MAYGRRCLGSWPAYSLHKYESVRAISQEIRHISCGTTLCWCWFPPFSMRCIHFRPTTFAVSSFTSAAAAVVHFYSTMSASIDFLGNGSREITTNAKWVLNYGLRRVPFDSADFIIFIFRFADMSDVSPNRFLLTELREKFKTILTCDFSISHRTVMNFRFAVGDQTTSSVRQFQAVSPHFVHTRSCPVLTR